MADFPSNVDTETSSPNSQNSQQGGNSPQGMADSITFRMDISFIRSIPAILMMAEIFLGLLHWALIASTPYTWLPAYHWVMFVAVTLWILTIILFFMLLCSVQPKLTAVPWPLTVMIYHGVATVLYITAFGTNAAFVTPPGDLHSIVYYYYYDHLAAAAFFGAVVTVAYGGSAFFSYLDWKGDGGNAATSTVPT